MITMKGFASSGDSGARDFYFKEQSEVVTVPASDAGQVAVHLAGCGETGPGS